MNLYIEYYIQEIIKILMKYSKIKRLKDKESTNLCETIEEFIKCIALAFESVYKDLINLEKTEMEIRKITPVLP